MKLWPDPRLELSPQRTRRAGVPAVEVDFGWADGGVAVGLSVICILQFECESRNAHAVKPLASHARTRRSNWMDVPKNLEQQLVGKLGDMWLEHFDMCLRYNISVSRLVALRIY